MEIPKEILEKIAALSKPAIIAISGFGGSGKSTFAGMLGERMGAPVVDVDSFARNRLGGGSNWDAFDFARLEREVLIPFIEDQDPIIHGQYDWGENAVISTRQVHHDGLLIIEGVGLFRPELLKYFSYKIWIDVPLEESIERGKKRDREVYNNPQDEKWNGIWKTNDTEFFEKFDPKGIADVIISNI